jgi:lysophospholipase L1-like esterase
MIAYGDDYNIPYEPYEAIDANPLTLYKNIKEKTQNSAWNGLVWLSYGDSITAQGNNGGGYQNIVDDMLGFGTSYRRGVGGQTYKANTSTFYANADGSYAGRYGSNGLTEAPEGTTTHLGYFASWDRITTMIPESIRESIDLVVLCGGTNDHATVEDVETDGIISAGVPVWVANSTIDAEWAAASDYAGGDYDINTFPGAIASTIMKMRIWCPNAVVVLATPYPRWDTTTMQQYTNSKGLDFREMCEIQIATAKYMGCPVCDTNAMSGMSATNFAGTVLDGVHPNTAGMKLYGKALADCLNGISPKIV